LHLDLQFESISITMTTSIWNQEWHQ